MGIFSKRSSGNSGMAEYSLSDVSGNDRLEVTGESHQRATHTQLYGNKTGHMRCQVVMLREPDNAYDPNAIAVRVVEQGGVMGRQLGYVNAADAAKLSASVDSWGGAAVCNASLFRKDPSHVWSVWLEVDLDELGI